MLQKKNEGILFSAEIRVVGSYTDRLLKSYDTTDFLKPIFFFVPIFGTLIKDNGLSLNIYIIAVVQNTWRKDS